MTRTRITCIVGDLTKQPDIVNSANPSMRSGSGICGASVVNETVRLANKSYIHKGDYCVT